MPVSRYSAFIVRLTKDIFFHTKGTPGSRVICQRFLFIDALMYPPLAENTRGLSFDRLDGHAARPALNSKGRG